MDSISYLSPTGVLGVGFSENHFLAAIASRDLAFIGCDAGSTDGGPANLGGNKPFFSRAAIKRDLRILVTGARSINVPLFIGSCGGSGGNWNLNWVWEIVQEIAREESLHFKTAIIESEVPRETLIQKYRDGKIKALDPAPEIDESVFKDADHIVAMMGAEAYVAALEGGADVVLAGRSTDAAIFAAVPVAKGFPAGLCWHAAKIMECGGAAVVTMEKPEGMICTVTQKDFTLEPVSPQQQCSPLSVAAHALYETADPYRMLEPGGEMDLTNAQYEAVDERRVRVTGSQFNPKPYTVKLEGAKKIGYRAMVLGGVRDPVILEQFDSWFGGLQDHISENIEAVYGESIRGQYQIDYKIYGRSGVLGAREPNPTIGNEVGLLMVTLAQTQEIAYAIAGQAAHMVLHHSVPQWEGLLSNLAFPIAPHFWSLGEAYQFVLNHVVELDHPLELHPIRYEDI
ncbi:acyclic terpene utilization AtuA family protein [Paraburkholderia sp. 1N]|uniref:Acyclic terpene utilization AtuA family protein n=1 Tax=Paraburkholderia solitsugae TaxID=2675748 RepID=A0ABX2BTI1_9BURK|nr:acyclic terpene utilization AtuA family protein [Paraburkholderia solitsugae]NPT43110.1 acyclic terpene utilization AtuA family protein [Paraburkholderia solitsugae]